MKKVYGLLVVAILSLIWLAVGRTAGIKQTELFVLDEKKDEPIIINAKYEYIDGNLVPMFIQTTETLEVYKREKSRNNILHKSFSERRVIYKSTYNGNFFASKRITDNDSKGFATSAEFIIYDSNGEKIWNKQTKETDFIFSSMFLGEYKNSWYMLFNYQEANKIAFLCDKFESKIKITEGFLIDVCVGANALLVLTCERPFGNTNNPQNVKWNVSSYSFDGKLQWKHQFLANDFGKPRIFTNNNICGVFYKSGKQLCSIAFNIEGKTIGAYSEVTTDVWEGYSLVVYGDTVCFFRNNCLKQLDIKTMKLIKQKQFSRDGALLFVDKDNLFIWQKNSKKGNDYSLCVLEKDLLVKSFMKINIPKEIWGFPIKVFVLEGHSVIVLEKIIISIKGENANE